MNHTIRILMMLMLVSVGNFLFSASFHRLSTTASAVNSAGVVVDTDGSSIHFVRTDSSDQFLITKTDINGGAVTGFGSNGVVTLTIVDSSSASSGTTVNSNGYTGFASGQDSYIAVDSSDRILVAMKIDFGVNSSVAVVRLIKSTGQLDATYGTNGVTMRGGVSNDYSLQGLIADSTGRAVTVFNKTDGTIAAIRFPADGSSSTFSAVSSGLISAATNGLDVAVDGSDNVFIAGKDGANAFCVKLLVADITVDATFGTSGAYSVSAGQDANSAVFVDVTATNIYLINLHNNDINFNLRTLNTSGSLSGNQNGIFPSAVVLKNVVRRPDDGSFYMSGTIDSGGQTLFLGRFIPNLGAVSGMSVFAQNDVDDGIANGVVKISPTSGSTVTSGNGGWIGYDSTTGAISIGSIETDGDSNINFIRDFGVEAGDDDVPAGPTPTITPSVASAAAPSTPSGGGRRDGSFAHITLGGTNLTAIDDHGIMVDNFDDTITYVRKGNVFIIAKINEQGGLETGFGTSGVRAITIAASGGSTTTAAITNFDSVIAAKMSYMTYDASNNILLAFQVSITGGTEQVAIVRLKADTGLIDTDFGTSGVATIAASADTHQVDGIFVDRQGKVVLLVYHDNGSGTTTAHVYRFSSSGVIEAGFGSGGKVTLSDSSLLVSAVAGLSAAIEVDGDIFIGGKTGTSPYNLFCIKLNSSDGSVDTDFGSSGKYATGSLFQLTTTSRAFVSVHQYGSLEQIQIISQGVDSGDPGILIAQISLTDGSADNVFGGVNSSFIEIDNLTTLNDVERNEEADILCGGILTESSVVKPFFLRITSSGDIDTTYGDESGDAKTGIIKLSATDSWTAQAGGSFAVDSGGGIPISWVEYNGTSYRLITQRLISTDDFDFDLTTVDNGDDFEAFVKARHFNDVDRLKAHLDIDAIAATLQSDWEAVGGVLDSATIATGVNLFKEAMGIVLRHMVNRANNNNFGSALGIPNKTGAMNKEMNVLMNKVENAFSTAQLTAMDAGVNNAFNKVFSVINFGREAVTGNTRNEPKAPSA